jgi:GT2 family glycosyltransferase
MSVSCVIVGLNEWERFTLPFLNSIYRNDPALDVIVVDNGSDTTYPAIDKGLLIRSDEKLSYAGGINLGMKAATSDWVMVANNDVLIHKPVSERIEALDPDELHGFYLVSKELPGLFDWDYLSGWCLIAHKRLWDAVGDFDENCKPMYFEDADYSVRAARAGFGLRLHDRNEWGIVHLEDSRHKERREYMDQHKEQRNAIKQYVRGKHRD